MSTCEDNAEIPTDSPPTGTPSLQPSCPFEYAPAEYERECCCGLVYAGGVGAVKDTTSLITHIPSSELFAELQDRRSLWLEKNPNVGLSSAQSLTAGVLSGVVARTVTAPLELVKTLLQLQRAHLSNVAKESKYKGMLHAAYTITKEEGIAALWKGNAVGCVRLGSYTGIKFLTYDTSKRYYTPSDFGHIERLAFGSFAGIGATVFTYPLDLIKTRLSIQKYGDGPYNSTTDAVRKIFRVEGARGLYKGLVPTVVGVVPFEGVQFATYEYLKEVTRNHRWPKWRWRDPNKTNHDSIDILTMGSIAGAAGQTVSYPLDLVRKRMQVQSNSKGTQKPLYRNSWHCLHTVVLNEGGIPALFKGTLPNLLRVIPYGALIFYTYELAGSLLKQSEEYTMNRHWEEYVERFGDDADSLVRANSNPIVSIEDEDMNVTSGN
eukprot:CFRG7420T1